MTTDKPRVTVQVSSAQHSGARVTIEPLVSALDINQHINRGGINLFSKDGMTFITSSDRSQVHQFLSIIIEAVEAAGYEVTNKPS